MSWICLWERVVRVDSIVMTHETRVHSLSTAHKDVSSVRRTSNSNTLLWFTRGDLVSSLGPDSHNFVKCRDGFHEDSCRTSRTLAISPKHIAESAGLERQALAPRSEEPKSAPDAQISSRSLQEASAKVSAESRAVSCDKSAPDAQIGSWSPQEASAVIWK